MNAARLLRACAQAQPGDPAVSFEGHRTDYLGLSMTAQRTATILSERFGIRPDNRVAVMLPNVPELALVHYAVLWAGAVVVVLDPGSDANALAAHLRRSGAVLLIAWHADAETAEAAANLAQGECLFVEPREFSHLVGATEARLTMQERRDSDLAVIAQPLTAGALATDLSHAELVDSGRSIARAQRLARLDAVGPAPDADATDVILLLNAVVAAGATLALPDPDLPRDSGGWHTDGLTVIPRSTLTRSLTGSSRHDVLGEVSL